MLYLLFWLERFQIKSFCNLMILLMELIVDWLFREMKSMFVVTLPSLVIQWINVNMTSQTWRKSANLFVARETFVAWVYINTNFLCCWMLNNADELNELSRSNKVGSAYNSAVFSAGGTFKSSPVGSYPHALARKKRNFKYSLKYNA